MPPQSQPRQGPVLRATGIHRHFGSGPGRIEVLRGIDLEIFEGERVFLCGASGAGKTTLLYTLGAMEAPDAGEVEIGGKSLYKLKPTARATMRHQLMGFVFQGYCLLPDLTALENVLVPAQIAGHKDSRARAASLLDQVGLGARLHHLPAKLSGGEQQRVAIARALMNDPTIVFADEPTGNLDSQTGKEVMDQLMLAAAGQGKALVVVTHDEELASAGDRTIRLADGMVADPTREGHHAR